MLLIISLRATECTIYKDFNSFKDSSINKTNLELIKRTSSSIAMVGGEDFKFNSLDSKTSTKDITKSIWGIKCQDTLYINCKIVKGTNGYAKVTKINRYGYFSASMLSIYSTNKDKLLYKEEDENHESYILAGGAIGGAQKALERWIYIIDFQTGDVKLLSKSYVSEVILKNNPELAKEFLEISKNDSQSTIDFLFKNKDKIK